MPAKVIKADRQFIYRGMVGYIFSGDYVRWGGCGFQVIAARGGLRTAIDKALGK